MMEAVKISPKFQVVIPRSVREKLHLVAGQRMQVVAYGNRIELIPEREITEMRGFLKGIDVTVERETDRV
jgi:AbrB family looped-hinge helix DNA binding protein